MFENEKTGNTKVGPLLYYEANTSLYQILTNYLTLVRFRIIPSQQPKEILQKLDRQKFSCILVAPDSETQLHQLLESLAAKESLNHNTPVLVILPVGKRMQVESRFANRVRSVVKAPFTLNHLHQKLLTALAV